MGGGGASGLEPAAPLDSNPPSSHFVLVDLFTSAQPRCSVFSHVAVYGPLCSPSTLVVLACQRLTRPHSQRSHISVLLFGRLNMFNFSNQEVLLGDGNANNPKLAHAQLRPPSRAAGDHHTKENLSHTLLDTSLDGLRTASLTALAPLRIEPLSSGTLSSCPLSTIPIPLSTDTTPVFSSLTTAGFHTFLSLRERERESVCVRVCVCVCVLYFNMPQLL